ncbi:MAG: hypothetical protein QM763_09480 [Agriterribacter sp.]
MRNRTSIFGEPITPEQLKQYCDAALPARLLSSESCIVVTPPLPPGAYR